MRLPLCEKCLYSEIFWYVYSRIWTEYGPEKLRARNFSRSVHSYVKDLYLWIIFLTLTCTESTLTRLIRKINFHEFRNFLLFCGKWNSPKNVSLHHLRKQILPKVLSKIPIIAKYVKIKRNWLCSLTIAIHFNNICFYNFMRFYAENVLLSWFQNFIVLYEFAKIHMLLHSPKLFTTKSRTKFVCEIIKSQILISLK